MAPSRKASNGRSPLVNQQRQITAFFGKKASELSDSPTPTPSLPSSNTKQNPSPNPSQSQSPSPTTPSPLQPKRNGNKPLLVIGPSSSSPVTPDSSRTLYGPEVVDKRIRVYWPLDKCWYEGCVKSFNEVSGKHLVQYDDADEELLNLSAEKIEWLVEEPPKRLRRLRKFSLLEDKVEEEKSFENVEEDDPADEDWGKSAEKEAVEEDVSENMDLDDEVDSNGVSGKSSINSKKRKVNENWKLNSNSGKKSRNVGDNQKKVDKVSSRVSEGKSTASAANGLDSE